jgi:hypothetical protein
LAIVSTISKRKMIHLANLAIVLEKGKFV